MVQVIPLYQFLPYPGVLAAQGLQQLTQGAAGKVHLKPLLAQKGAQPTVEPHPDHRTIQIGTIELFR